MNSGYWTESERFASAAVAPRAPGGRGCRISFLALSVVILVSFVALNAQKPLYAYLGHSATTTSTHPLTLLWLIAPIALWGLLIPVLTCRARLRTAHTPLIFWLAVLVGHSALFALISGPRAGVASFVSWGIWASLPLMMDEAYWRRCFYLFLLILFSAAAVANALPILYEWAYDIPIFKEVTRAGAIRRYGISQSVSVVGVQLAVGIIALLGLLDLCRASLWRCFVVLAATGLVLLALIATTSRAPMIWLVFALALLIWMSRLSPAVKITATVGAGACAAIAVFVALGGMIESTYLRFLTEALSLQDAGNLERFAIYERTLTHWAGAWQSVVFGYGSGKYSALADYFGVNELGVESSVLKLLIELGLFGTAPLVLFVGTIVCRSFRRSRRASNNFGTYLLAMLVVVILQASIHEILKAWIIQFYFFALLAGLLQLPPSRPRSRTQRHAVFSGG